MNEKFAALVPMKGHSERVNNKNVRKFGDKPLLCHILQALHKSVYVSKIYVDTDSEEIASIAAERFNRIEIIKRPAKLCGDMVSMNDIIKYDISEIGADYYIQSHATNPLLQTCTIDQACKKYLCALDRYDSLFTVNKVQARFYDKMVHPINHDPDCLIRTQDLEPWYEENSNLYIFSKDSFIAANARIGKRPQMLVMNPLESVDIDEESDFVLAEEIYKSGVLRHLEEKI